MQKFLSSQPLFPPTRYSLGCLRRTDSDLVFRYEARPKPNLISVPKECAKSRARTLESLTEINFRPRFRFFFQPTKKHKFKSRTLGSLTEINFRPRFRFFFQPTKKHKYKSQLYRLQATTPISRGERSFTCSAEDRSGSVAWYDGKKPAPAALIINGAVHPFR